MSTKNGRLLMSALALAALVVNVVGCSSSSQPIGSTASTGASSATTHTIQSERALNLYLQATAKTGSPFDALAPDAKARFLSSLAFNERGLTAYRYDDLRNLSAEQVTRILGLFGFQKDESFIIHPSARNGCPQVVVPGVSPQAVPTPDCNGNYPNYNCVSRATCAPSNNFVCTKNC